MIDVQEATRIVGQTRLNLSTVRVPLKKAMGRVLRQSVVADADFPPFDRVMMDGIAIRFDDFARGIREFRITGVQAAGSPQTTLANSGDGIEVMTGAVAPAGADSIIPYEQVNLDPATRKAGMTTDSVKAGQNIHNKGIDKKKGDVLIEVGTLIEAPEIAVAASVGSRELEVTQNPTVAIISTGNELVEITETPLPHQIRRSNVHGIAAELRQLGIRADLFHFSDEKKALKSNLKKVLDEHQLIILSGGVSKGRFDFVPETLTDLGVDQLFHRVKQKPGKPFWFGSKVNEKVVFAFPGNPVSTFLCFHKYLLPWLRKSLGLKLVNPLKAVLAEDFSIKTPLTYYLQVKTEIDRSGVLLAHPLMGKGSGDHANLLSSDAFLELPAETFEFRKDEIFNLIPFRKR